MQKGYIFDVHFTLFTMLYPIQQEGLDALWAMNIHQILDASTEAKTRNRGLYRDYIPSITKRETAWQLDLLIALAKEGIEITG